MSLKPSFFLFALIGLEVRYGEKNSPFNARDRERSLRFKFYDDVIIHFPGDEKMGSYCFII